MHFHSVPGEWKLCRDALALQLHLQDGVVPVFFQYSVVTQSGQVLMGRMSWVKGRTPEGSPQFTDKTQIKYFQMCLSTQSSLISVGIEWETTRLHSVAVRTFATRM